jgi:RNA polymerase sigma factor (sigma-70 family)
MAKALGKHALISGSTSFAGSAMQRYARQIHSYLSRRLRQRQDIDDIAQEVYLRLLRTDTTSVKKPLSFVLGVAAHVVADHWSSELQNAQRFPSAGDAYEAYGDLASDLLRDRVEDLLSLRQEVERILSQMPPIQVAVLLLIKRDGYSYEEAAAKLGLSVHIVHSNLTTARAAFRRLYNSD